jgi:hypothetical protein
VTPPRTFEVGERFKMLTVIERRDPLETSSLLVSCRCDCGQEIQIEGRSLGNRTGRKSCGCTLTRPGSVNPNWRGGKRTHPLYTPYRSLLDRVDNPNNKRYADYGGRGITVCDSWRDFWVFVDDMGERPAGTSLDRINNDGNYEPENCRWATASQQARNKRPGSWDAFRALSLTRAKAQRAAPACHLGHEYTPENTYVNPNSKRRACRTCTRASRERTRANYRRAA